MDALGSKKFVDSPKFYDRRHNQILLKMEKKYLLEFDQCVMIYVSFAKPTIYLGVNLWIEVKCLANYQIRSTDR